MKLKTTALLVTIFTVGATAPIFAASACCSAPAGAKTSAEKPSSNPTRLMLVSYERMANALAADDLKTAQQNARTFGAVCQVVCESAEVGDKMKECEKHVQAFLKETDIAKAREQFKLISASVIELAEKEEGYLVMTCPMAGEKADWLQSDSEVRNPYHGSKMLRCGSVKEKQEAAASGG